MGGAGGGGDGGVAGAGEEAEGAGRDVDVGGELEAAVSARAPMPALAAGDSSAGPSESKTSWATETLPERTTSAATLTLHLRWGASRWSSRMLARCRSGRDFELREGWARGSGYVDV